MHVRVRMFGKPDTVVVVESKLTKIDQFRKIIEEKFDVPTTLQRLFYGGKLLENGYTFHDYNIKLNDVIQLMVKVQLDENPVENKTSEKIEEKSDKEENKEELYKDTQSTLYAIGDFVDARDSTSGAWVEGKIDRIVFDTNDPNLSSIEQNNDKENDLGPSPERVGSENSKPKLKGIAKYMYNTPKILKEAIHELRKIQKQSAIEDSLLFRVQLEDENHFYCKHKDVRPRARRVLSIQELVTGMTVMLNYNPEEPGEIGDWYDFKIDEIIKVKRHHELHGTLYLGSDAIPQNDTTVKVIDKIFAIDVVTPLKDRTPAYQKIQSTEPEKRSRPPNCEKCKDDFDLPCKYCGCYLCSGKEEPENILLCDECNNGFHMKCLSPPLTEVPDEDWYCLSCKRDPTEVIAPGASKQSKKTSASKSKRDWGRGMACVGKTKTCAMPSNHFGPIPGIEVGMCWRFRIQLCESGVHRPPVSGIHGRESEGAYSIVLSGGYEDDVDHGNKFTYTGSGGRDLSGNKRTAEQSCDQLLTRENKALALNCATKLNEAGGDAGEHWREGKPVRVVRSNKMLKHSPKYAPKEGLRYDGIYKVVKYYPEKGLSGYLVWKYLLRRDDPNPAPWERGGKIFSIIYPDGYLEAEAEKKALKEKNKPTKTKGSKKRVLQESNQAEDDESTPMKKQMTIDNTMKNTKDIKGTQKTKALDTKSPKGKSFNGKLVKGKSKRPGDDAVAYTDDDLAVVRADTLNAKLWEECLELSKNSTKQEFLERVRQIFLCSICQEVVVNPVTTPCLHNYCLDCIKRAFKMTETQKCACCRQPLDKDDLQVNGNLKTALRVLLLGYDAGK